MVSTQDGRDWVQPSLASSGSPAGQRATNRAFQMRILWAGADYLATPADDHYFRAEGGQELHYLLMFL